MGIFRSGAIALGVGLLACGGSTEGEDEGQLGPGAQSTGGLVTGGQVDSGGSPSGGRAAGGLASLGASSGDESSGGRAAGGDRSAAHGGASGDGGNTGNTDGGASGDGGLGGQPAAVLPELIGVVARSCGDNMWSLDGQTLLTCGPGDEHENHPECVIVDCTAHGDTASICVFGNHCRCSEGFVCDDDERLGGECTPRVGCIPQE